MNRIQQLIEKSYPGRVTEIEQLIERMKFNYDQSQFLEEDILENILIELNII
jgi:hypothetical protein